MPPDRQFEQNSEKGKNLNAQQILDIENRIGSELYRDNGISRIGFRELLRGIRRDHFDNIQLPEDYEKNGIWSLPDIKDGNKLVRFVCLTGTVSPRREGKIIDSTMLAIVQREKIVDKKHPSSASVKTSYNWIIYTGNMPSREPHAAVNIPPASFHIVYDPEDEVPLEMHLWKKLVEEGQQGVITAMSRTEKPRDESEIPKFMHDLTYLVLLQGKMMPEGLKGSKQLTNYFPQFKGQHPPDLSHEETQMLQLGSLPENTRPPILLEPTKLAPQVKQGKIHLSDRTQFEKKSLNDDPTEPERPINDDLTEA